MSEKPLESNSLVKGISDQGSVNLLRNPPELSLTPNQTVVVFLYLCFLVHTIYFFPQYPSSIRMTLISKEGNTPLTPYRS